MAELDVVVIGAGAAGLAATKTLRDRGFAVQAIEARGRVGGRAHTDRAHYGVPVDLGCAWLHSADINPFRRIAAEVGFTVLEREPRWRGRIGKGDLSPAEQAAVERTIDEGFAAMTAAGQQGCDIAVAEVVQAAAPGRPLFDAIITWVFGTDPARASVLDHARYNDTGHNWPIVQGYGALVEAYGAGLPVKFSTPALAIDWRGPGVRVATSAGAIAARAAIVTLPTGVLAEERVAFRPNLPPAKLAAIEHIPLGIADKVIFRVEGDPFGLPAGSFVNDRHDSPGISSLEIRPFGRDIVICYFGGSFARELEETGSMIEAAGDALVRAFGSDVQRHLRSPLATSWFGDPCARGSYSAAEPGHAHRRADLAAPLEDRLFFAGEACSPDSFSTCHGAYLSGIAAADAAAGALRQPS